MKKLLFTALLAALSVWSYAAPSFIEITKTPEVPTLGSKVKYKVNILGTVDNPAFRIYLYATFDGMPIALQNNGKDKYKWDSQNLSSGKHVLKVAVFLEDAVTIDNLLSANSLLEDEINTLTTQLSHTTDPVLIAQIQARIVADNAEIAKNLVAIEKARIRAETKYDSFTIVGGQLDTIPPSLTINPDSGTTLISNKPLVTVNFSDASDIDLDSLKILVNGKNWTTKFTVTQNASSYQMNDKHHLKPGANTIEVRISDIWGNEASISATYSVTAPSVCGDGIIQSPGEQCEAGNLNNQTCQGLGFLGGQLGCSSQCTFDVSQCSNTIPLPPSATVCNTQADCGAGECGMLPTGIKCCMSDPLSNTCTAGVSLDFRPDNGPSSGGTIVELRFPVSENPVTIPAVSFGGSPAEVLSSFVSNGNLLVYAITPGSNPGSTTVTIRADYASGSISRTSDRLFNFSAQAQCGNGQIEQGEACEMGLPITGSCQDYGYTGGQLGCSPSCSIDTSSCTNNPPSNIPPGATACSGDSDCGGASSELVCGSLTPGDAQCCMYNVASNACAAANPLDFSPMSGTTSGGTLVELRLMLQTSENPEIEPEVIFNSQFGQVVSYSIDHEQLVVLAQTPPHPAGEVLVGLRAKFSTGWVEKSSDRGFTYVGGVSCQTNMDCPAGTICQGGQCQATSHCGNGMIEPGEQCEIDMPISQTCQDFDYPGGTLSCRPNNCTIDTSGCNSGSGETSCLDGIDNDGNGLTDCQDPSCAGNPACPVGPVCGNGTCEEGETPASCPGDCGQALPPGATPCSGGGDCNPGLLCGNLMSSGQTCCMYEPSSNACAVNAMIDVSPSSGPTEGGPMVVFQVWGIQTGGQQATGFPTVLFGSSNANIMNFMSMPDGVMIYSQSPANPAGPVDVRITIPYQAGSIETRLPGGFTYTDSGGAVCGNGTVEPPGESCDPPGQSMGSMVCGPTCQWQPAQAVCGNGIPEQGEVCDNGSNDGSYGGCMPSCMALGPYCGDHVVNGPEACDEGGIAANGCTVSCTLDTVNGPVVSVSPNPGVFLESKTPTITIGYSDPDGVNQGSLSIKLNSNDVTSFFSVYPINATWAIDEGHSLKEGKNVFEVTLSDVQGATTRRTFVYYVKGTFFTLLDKTQMHQVSIQNDDGGWDFMTDTPATLADTSNLSDGNQFGLHGLGLLLSYDKVTSRHTALIAGEKTASFLNEKVIFRKNRLFPPDNEFLYHAGSLYSSSGYRRKALESHMAEKDYSAALSILGASDPAENDVNGVDQALIDAVPDASRVNAYRGRLLSLGRNAGLRAYDLYTRMRSSLLLNDESYASAIAEVVYQDYSGIVIVDNFYLLGLACTVSALKPFIGTRPEYSSIIADALSKIQLQKKADGFYRVEASEGALSGSIQDQAFIAMALLDGGDFTGLSDLVSSIIAAQLPDGSFNDNGYEFVEGQSELLMMLSEVFESGRVNITSKRKKNIFKAMGLVASPVL